MKVILKQDVPNIGQKYDVKNVSDGYARNYLIPRRLAEIATNKAIKNIGTLKKALSDKAKIQEDLVAKNVDDLDGVVIEIKEKANELGHLFAGIHKDEIVLVVKKQTNLDILPDFITLDEPIKSIGEYDIAISHGEKKGTFKLKIEEAE
jgi:large subunit ribosomal protein L9